LKNEDGLTATRSAMRTYLRAVAACLRILPVHEKAKERSNAREDAFVILKLHVAPFLSTLKKHDDEIDAGDEESAKVMRDNRLKAVDNLFAACKDVINKHAGDQLESQKKVFMALLTPRQSFGLSTWHSTLRLMIKKLPGGKVFAKKGGPWHSYLSLYYSSLLHEADVLMYLLLVTLTLDHSLVQYFIASPRHCQAVIDIHDLLSWAIVDVDRSECAALPDEDAETRGTNWNQELSDLLNGFVAPKKKNAEKGDEADDDEERPKLKIGSSLQYDMCRVLTNCAGM
jgi:hypothetical protein